MDTHESNEAYEAYLRGLSLAELLGVEAYIDQNEYPDRYELVKKCIAEKQDEEWKHFPEDPFACFRKVRWTKKDVLFGIGILVLFYAFGRLFPFPVLFGNNPRAVLISILFLSTLSQIYLFIYPCFVCRKLDISPLFPPLTFSMLMKEFVKSIKYYFIAALSIGIIIRVISFISHYTAEPSGTWQVLGKYAHVNFYVLFFLISGFTLFPIFEEVFFRGFLFNAFKARLPVFVAVVLQSLVFTMFHSSNLLGIISIFLTGIALAIIYERRKSLLAPIFVHGTINFAGILRIFLTQG